MNIKYDRYLIAYLDILGFKKICMESEKIGNTEKLNDIYRICLESIERLKNIDTKKDIKSVIISDSIILGMSLSPTKEKFSAKEIADFLLAVGRIQFDLFKSEILLRGGISIGKAFFDLDQKIVVGPAFVEAYELEVKQAIFPRVVVSSKVASEIASESFADFIVEVNHEYQKDRQRALFNWDSHGDGFLNRLTKDIPFFIDFIRSYPGDILEIRKRCDETVHIINNMAQKHSDHYAKYKWLEDYWLTTYGQVVGTYQGKTVTSLTSFHG